jgi:hypothetical protein
MDNIKNMLKITYLNNLILTCNKLLINVDFLTKKINELELNNKIEDSPILKQDSEVNNIMSENSDYLYLKSWNKLTLIHKIIKIKEFVTNLNINNIEEKEILKEKLIELIKNKNLIKNNKINYDSAKGKIISISCLLHNNNKYDIVI